MVKNALRKKIDDLRMRFNFSLDTALIIAALTAFLYTCGQVYLVSYLSHFLVDPVALNIPPQDKIYWGFLNAWQYLAWFLIIVSLFYLIKYLEIVPFIDNFIQNKIFKINKIRKHTPPIFNLNANAEVREIKSENFFNIIFIIILSFYSMFAFAQIDIETRKKTKKTIENVYYLPKINLSNNTKPQFLITCGASLCAIIDEEKNISLVEPKNVVILGSNFKHNKVS